MKANIKYIIGGAIILIIAFAVAWKHSQGLYISYDGDPDSDFEEEFVSDDEDTSVVSDIDWYSKTVSYTDGDGYEYEIEWKYSPWMLLSSQEETLKSAWNEIEAGVDLPGFDDWGLDESGVRQFSSGNPFIHSLNDMYYCIGEVTITNKTEGWSFTEEHPTEFPFASLKWKEEGHPHYEINTISRIYYENGSTIRDMGGEARIDALMTSDQWGPVSFIMMAPENFTPNNPDGAYYEAMTTGVMHISPGGDDESVDIVK